MNLENLVARGYNEIAFRWHAREREWWCHAWRVGTTDTIAGRGNTPDAALAALSAELGTTGAYYARKEYADKPAASAPGADTGLENIQALLPSADVNLQKMRELLAEIKRLRRGS